MAAVKLPIYLRYWCLPFVRQMSQYPTYYVDAMYDKNKLKEYEREGLMHEKSFIPVKAAKSDDTTSVFLDPLIRKFVNIVMRHGRKQLARELVEETFEKVKRIQLRKYNSAKTEEGKASIECDPLVIFRKAMENVTPIMATRGIKRGGVIYQVPVPITAENARFRAMKWLWMAGKEKDKKIHFPTRLAGELIDAYHNNGFAVRKKQELHRLCEANRAFAHYRWS